MEYFGLKEPAYSEITRDFWYKLPLCLEYIKFLQKKYYQDLQQSTNTPAASGSSGNKAKLVIVISTVTTNY